MLTSLLNSLFQEPKAKLRWQYQIQYGPYLKKNPNSVSEPFYTYIVKRARTYLTEESTILETGCGLGRLAIDFANLPKSRVTGIDTNVQFIDEAKAISGGHRQNIISYKSTGTPTFVVADVCNIPFPDNSFTFVSCVNVIDRIDDPQKCIAELYRVLTPGGILFLSDPYDWDNTITPDSRQVSDMKLLHPIGKMKILLEEESLPFEIYVNAHRTTQYRNHLLVMKK